MSKRVYLLIIVTITVRLAFIYIAVPALGLFDGENLDSDGHWNLATEIRSGEYFTTETAQSIRRMPMYGALIAFFTEFPSIKAEHAKLWHIAMECCIVLSIYLFCRKYLGKNAGTWAGLLYAFYPLALYRIALLNTEIIQSTVMCFLVLSGARLFERKSIKDGLIFSGLSIFVLCISPSYVLFPPLVCLTFFFAMDFSSTARLAAAIMIPIIVFTLGWGARNAYVTGEFYLFDLRGGKEFWLGNNQRVDGRWEGPTRDVWEKEIEAHWEKMTEMNIPISKRNSYWYQQGISEILSNPARAAVLFVKKFFRFWYVPASEQMLKIIIPLQSFYLFFAGLGIWFTLKRNGLDKRVLLPVGLAAYFCAIYTLSYACIRFSYPVMPWISALAGVGVATMFSSWFGGQDEIAPTG